jgi:hypothetical protein
MYRRFTLVGCISRRPSKSSTKDLMTTSEGDKAEPRNPFNLHIKLLSLITTYNHNKSVLKTKEQFVAVNTNVCTCTGEEINAVEYRRQQTKHLTNCKMANT